MTATIISVAAVLSPLITASLLCRITMRGPQALAGDVVTPISVIAAFVTTFAAFFADGGLTKFLILSASGLATFVPMIMSAVFTTFPHEFSKDAP